jgi:serralysin
MAETRLRLEDIFDPNYYRQQNPDLGNISNQQALQHFRIYGLQEGRQFSPFFDLAFFEANNPSLSSFINSVALQNFFDIGLPAGVQFSPVFDLNFYRASNPDLGNLDNNQLFRHFLTSGLNEGRNFNPLIDLNFYRAANPDLAGLSNQDLFNQFLRDGLREGRPSLPLFDTNFDVNNNPDWIFDVNYYRQNNPDLATLDDNELFRHFLNFGLNEGRNFYPLIDLNFYRQSNPDLGNLGNNELLRHLVTSGLNEGRKFHPLIDLNFYRQSNPDLARLSNRDLLNHFWNSGLAEGRPSLPLFDVGFYLASNRDLGQNGIGTNQQAINHFINFGLNEGRRFSPFFDVDYYLTNNQDLVVAGFNRRQAYDHFRNFGVNQGRRFSRFFDTNYYLGNNHDLRATGLTPGQAFNHFLNFGIDEGRRPSVLFDPVYYLANNPDLAARQISFRDAFKQFQTEGFSQARSSSLWFDPVSIAPLLSVRQGPELQPIDQWLANADKWLDIPVGGTLTYSFVTTASAPLYQGGETGVREVTPEIKNNVRNIMRNLSQYIPINFVEVPDRPPNFGRIRVMFSNGPASNPRDGVAYAYAYLPSEFPGSNIAGDIHLNPDRSLIDFSAGPGSFGYQVLLHEIGHSLGLNHPFEDIYQLPPGRDNNTNTVMTYNDDPAFYNGSFAITPMAFDIRALQYLYGATYHNQGDTVYNFDINNFIGPNQRDGRNSFKQTIWDSGGVDTLNFAALPPIPGGYYFNMNEGGQNTTQFALNGSVYSIRNPGSTETQSLPRIPLLTDSFGTTIGFGVEIENLVGSQGDDEIIGNNLANNIIGGPGNDTITGARGADILTGGDGSDIFVFALGDGSTNPNATNIITDFQPGIDKIGLSLGLPSSSVAITQGTGVNAANTLIWVPITGEYLAVLRNVPASLVSFSDFIPV